MRATNCVVLTVIAFVVLVAVNVSASEIDEIRIGVIGPMKYMHGKSHWNGALMAAEEINAVGGIKLGQKRLRVKLIKADSNEFVSIDSAKKAMEKLVVQDKVNFVVGGISTEATLAMQEVAMDNRTLFLGCGAAHPVLCDRVVENYNRYKYFFRASPFNTEYLMKNLFSFVRIAAFVLTDQLAIDHVKVGILVEDAMWTDSLGKVIEEKLKLMGFAYGGVWRISGRATDLSAELGAIKNKSCHILLSLINGPVGVVLGRQYGEMKIPTLITGYLIEANSLKWPEMTQGMGDYIMTAANYIQGAAYNDLTEPFINKYVERFGDVPTFTSNTYQVIKNTITPAIEKVGSLDSDKLIPFLEHNISKNPDGNGAYLRDEMGRPVHDVRWGPGYATGMAGQWQNGKFVAVWPYFKWRSPRWDFAVQPSKKPNEMSYTGLHAIVIPPWMIKTYGSKEGESHVARIPVPKQAEASEK